MIAEKSINNFTYLTSVYTKSMIWEIRTSIFADSLKQVITASKLAIAE